MCGLSAGTAVAISDATKTPRSDSELTDRPEALGEGPLAIVQESDGEDQSKEVEDRSEYALDDIGALIPKP